MLQEHVLYPLEGVVLQVMRVTSNGVISPNWRLKYYTLQYNIKQSLPTSYLHGSGRRMADPAPVHAFWHMNPLVSYSGNRTLITYVNHLARVSSRWGMGESVSHLGDGSGLHLADANRQLEYLLPDHMALYIYTKWRGVDDPNGR